MFKKFQEFASHVQPSKASKELRNHSRVLTLPKSQGIWSVWSSRGAVECVIMFQMLWTFRCLSIEFSFFFFCIFSFSLCSTFQHQINSLSFLSSASDVFLTSRGTLTNVETFHMQSKFNHKLLCSRKPYCNTNINTKTHSLEHELVNR